MLSNLEGFSPPGKFPRRFYTEGFILEASDWPLGAEGRLPGRGMARGLPAVGLRIEDDSRIFGLNRGACTSRS
jgi:hypothetical protein